MSGRQIPRIASRKHPKQARSTELVAAILQAATRVLAEEGAQRFTTARVAEKAGISIGSLYQYFPNKTSILFRLQYDEWQQTTAMLRDILNDNSKHPLTRLRVLVHAFIQSECDESAMRVALNDAAPLYRDAPEALAAKSEGDKIYQVFMQEVLPGTPEEVLLQASELIITTLGSVGHAFSESPRTQQEIKSWADSMADMFCAYIDKIRKEENAMER